MATSAMKDPAANPAKGAHDELATVANAEPAVLPTPKSPLSASAAFFAEDNTFINCMTPRPTAPICLAASCASGDKLVKASFSSRTLSFAIFNKGARSPVKVSFSSVKTSFPTAFRLFSSAWPSRIFCPDCPGVISGMPNPGDRRAAAAPFEEPVFDTRRRPDSAFIPKAVCEPIFFMASPTVFRLTARASTRRFESDTALSNRFFPASSIWYLSKAM